MPRHLSLPVRRLGWVGLNKNKTSNPMEIKLNNSPTQYPGVTVKSIWKEQKELIRSANPIETHTWKDGKKYEWPVMRSGHPVYLLEESWNGPVRAAQMLEDLACDAERIYRLIDLLTLMSQHGGDVCGFDDLIHQIRTDQRTLCNVLAWLGDRTPADDGSVINEFKDAEVKSCK